MSAILESVLDDERRDQANAADAAAFAIDAARGIVNLHGVNSGECAVMLDTLPVRVRYELTMDGADEIAEIVSVLVCGHVVEAANFDADTRRCWADECMQSRGDL